MRPISAIANASRAWLVVDLQGAHDVHCRDAAQFERTDKPKYIVPVRRDPIEVDALSRQAIEFAIVGLGVDAPEARSADVRQAGTEAASTRSTYGLFW